MGLYPSADLVYGIPIRSHDQETGEPTFWWSEENEYWIDLSEHDHNLKIIGYGHYDDPDGMRAILSSPRVDAFTADAWTPSRVDPMNVERYNDKALSKASDSLRALEAPITSFYGNAGWYLTASYG